MKKPESFFSLPIPLQENLLWDMELDYCPYESSKVACIHDILNSTPNDISDENLRIIRNYYKALSDASLYIALQNCIQKANYHLCNLENFRDSS